MKELIEQLRQELNEKIAEGKELTDPEILAASVRLDAILNEYGKLLREKKRYL